MSEKMDEGAGDSGLESKSLQVEEEARARREVLKSGFATFAQGYATPQGRGLPKPPIEKPRDPGQSLIALPSPSKDTIRCSSIFDCLARRESRRSYANEALSLEELSWLLWATQGVRKTVSEGKVVLRTSPSGGNRHPFETYLAVFNVAGLEEGLYRYLPLEAALVREARVPDLRDRLIAGANGQRNAGDCAVCFIWTAIPYRSEWRYLGEAAKLILQDSGHLCQNLYLAAEAIDCGTVALGAYDQQLMDGLLGLDGNDELVVYMAPLGRAEAR